MALVVVSILVGAKVVGSADDTTAMWSVRTDKAPGDVIVPSDLVTTRVRFDDPSDADKYFTAADTLPNALYLLRGIGAGELVPRAGLGESDPDLTHVSVSVPTAMFPPKVTTGSRVDLWVAPSGTSDRGSATRAVRDVVVLEVPQTNADLAGAATDRQVVLAVPDRQDVLAQVLTASGSGRLMLVGRG